MHRRMRTSLAKIEFRVFLLRNGHLRKPLRVQLPASTSNFILTSLDPGLLYATDRKPPFVVRAAGLQSRHLRGSPCQRGQLRECYQVQDTPRVS